MQHDIVFAIVVLIADDLAFLILAELGDVMGYREDCLLRKFSQLRYLVKHICHKIRAEPLHIIPHVENVSITNQQNVYLVPCAEPGVLSTIPTIIIIYSDYISWIVCGCNIGVC